MHVFLFEVAIISLNVAGRKLSVVSTDLPKKNNQNNNKLINKCALPDLMRLNKELKIKSIIRIAQKPMEQLEYNVCA